MPIGGGSPHVINRSLTQTHSRWHRDRRVIIGDAAHAPSPSSGKDASLTILTEDGVMFAKCLRDFSDPTAAFTSYEQARRGSVVEHGARTGSHKTLRRLVRILHDLALPIALRLLASVKSLGHINAC